MNTLDIIYIRYFDKAGKEMTIGGIQTYITRLSHLRLVWGRMCASSNMLIRGL